MKYLISVFVLVLNLISAAEALAEKETFVCSVTLTPQENVAGYKTESASSYVTDAVTSGTYGVLKRISDTRVLVYNGVIGLHQPNEKIQSDGGIFKFSLQEVDCLKNGFVTLENPVIVLGETTLFSPYDTNARNKAQSYETPHGKIYVQCSTFDRQEQR